MRSLGEAAGLQAGDVISAVNGQDISLLKHKEAQEAIKLAGNNFVLTILRYELISKYVGMYVCSTYITHSGSRKFKKGPRQKKTGEIK